MLASRPQLEIRERLVHGRKRLTLIGELDLASAGALEQRLDQLRFEDVDVWLDLSRLDFIDSTGLRVLISHATQSHPWDWRVEIEPILAPAVRRLFELTGADELLPAT